MGSFCGPGAITGDYDSEEFPSFSNFDSLQENTVAKVVSHSEIARAVGNRTLSPGSILPLEIDQVPMAFGRYEGST